MSFDPRLTVSVSQSLPAVASGATTSFTVSVVGARAGHVAAVNPPTTLLASLAWWAANVTAKDVVTVTLKASAAISAGTQTFLVAVI